MTNPTNVFDVIVVGAGPGGSMAAKTAAEHGLSTCLLEKELLGETGRYKACGGALDWKLIEQVNYPEEKIERVIDSLEIHHIDGENYTKKGRGAVVWRSTFDKFITDKAVISGATLKENEPLIAIEKISGLYQITTSKSKYLAKYVIAADGVKSPTLKKLEWSGFAREDLILTITQEMTSSKPNIDQSLGSNAVHLYFGIKNFIPVGYAWLFPKTNTITTGWGNKLPLVTNAREEYKKFLNLPTVTETLKHSKLKLFRAQLIPVGLRPIMYEDNVFAIGDAGGFVDPISGKGIPYAMMSGKIALDTIIACDNRGASNKLDTIYKRSLEKKFLTVFKAKRIARDKIFQNDESLKHFLSLWEKYRSSEIVKKKLI